MTPGPCFGPEATSPGSMSSDHLKMSGRWLSEIGAPAFLIAGTACAFLQTLGESIRNETWLAIGWLVGAGLALAPGSSSVVIDRDWDGSTSPAVPPS